MERNQIHKMGTSQNFQTASDHPYLNIYSILALSRPFCNAALIKSFQPCCKVIDRMHFSSPCSDSKFLIYSTPVLLLLSLFLHYLVPVDFPSQVTMMVCFLTKTRSLINICTRTIFSGSLTGK